MYKNDNVTRRYSEAFKLKTLAEFSPGKYIENELGRLYCIAYTTIHEWVREYEPKDFMNTKVMGGDQIRNHMYLSTSKGDRAAQKNTSKKGFG